MRGLVFPDRLGRVGTAFIGGVSPALVRGHAEEVRRRQDGAWRSAFAFRAALRRIAFCHRPHLRERTAIGAEIVVIGHFVTSRVSGRHQPRRTRGGGFKTVPHLVALDYLSCDSGIWMSPLMCLIGPAEDGMISKSKISVGSHNVAQAFGTSTTPEMWPWHGAVPRIE